MLNRTLALVAAFVLAAGCAAETSDEPLSWEEYKSLAYQDPETGVYVVNGDEPALDDAALYEYYEAYLAGATGIAKRSDPLTINVVNGAWDRWPSGQVLTYCISNKFSASRKAALVQAIQDAGAEWAAAGNISFQYVPAQDGNCTNRNNNVTFNVKSVCRGQYLASAFFPSYARRSRELSVDCTAFGNIAPWTLAGIMRHELGHTIGFRHEHVRAPGNPCPEGGSFEGLTPYDSDSVMHYPQCQGTQGGDLVLTASDRAGAAVAYP
jgi:hypothetical protein